MKFIKDRFDSLRPFFTKGGRFERLHPVFEAFETLFFIPGHVAESGPHIRDSLDLKRYMSFVIIALLPPLFYGIYNTGFQACHAAGLNPDLITALTRGLRIVLPLIIVSYTVGFFWEVVFASVRGHNISEGFLVTGLLFPLTLPPTIPLWQAAMGITFGVVIGKEVFGGTGRNILNPALTGRAFLFFAYPGKMSGDTVWAAVSESCAKSADIFSGATPLSLSAMTRLPESIETALAENGYRFSNLFMGSTAGSIGETSAAMCLIGALLLTVLGVASYRIIIGGVTGVLFTGFLLNFLPAQSPWFSLDPFHHLVMGGFAFGITYMATDPVTAPGMESMKWIYGFSIGMLTILIRVFNPAYPEGVMLAILFMNLFSPLLDHLAIRFRLRKRVPNV